MKETKFDVFVEGLEERRFQAKNEEINRALALSLRTKTREEVVNELFCSLTFVIGTGTVLAKEERKTLAF